MKGPTCGGSVAQLRVNAGTGQKGLRVHKHRVFCKHFSVKRGLMMKFGCLLAGLILMVIEWREREHEGADNEALNHPSTVDALRQCGLLKYF